jgi:hypothetical protein
MLLVSRKESSKADWMRRDFVLLFGLIEAAKLRPFIYPHDVEFGRSIRMTNLTAFYAGKFLFVN